MTEDIVADTARRFGISVREIFRRVGVEKGLTDATMDNRYELWFKFGECPTYVADWCLTKWEEPFPLPAFHCPQGCVIPCPHSH